MARVYSEQLIHTTVAGGTTAEYTVTSGFVVVIRDMQVFLINPPGPGDAFQIITDGLTVLQWNMPGDWLSTESWQGRIVVPGPSTFTAGTAGLTAVAEITISGYVLTTP